MWTQIAISLLALLLTFLYFRYKLPAAPPGLPLGAEKPIFGVFLDVVKASRKKEAYLFFDKTIENSKGRTVLMRIPGQLVYLTSDHLIAKQVLHGSNETEWKNSLARTRSFGSVIKYGLLSLQGDLWRKHRKILQPAFSPAHLRNSVDHINSTVDTLFQKWESQKENKINIHQGFAGFALDAIGKILFGYDFESINMNTKKDSKITAYEAIETVMAALAGRGRTPKMLQVFITDKKFYEAVNFIRTTVQQVIDQRRRERNESGANYEPRDLLDQILKTNSDGIDVLSDEEIHDEIVMFQFAGHETTANSLSWSILYISKHPEVLKKLYEEAKEVIPDNGQVSYDDVSKLKYTEQVLKETLRIHTTVPLTGRTAAKDMILKTEQGDLPISKGSAIILSFFSQGRDKGYWKDPLEFIPERFADDQPKPAPGMYQPFGDGPRNCIGQKLAMIEMKICLARFIRRYPHFTLSEQEPIVPTHTITLGPKKGLWIDLN